MDVDSPSSRIDEEDDEEETSYNAELLELEPLREDSVEELDGDNDDDDDEDNDDNEDNDEQSSDAESSSSSASEQEDDDAHVQGLTSNEREILTLLAVDKKLASLLDLAANALAALRPKETKQQPTQAVATGDTDQSAPKQPEAPLKLFEAASAEYYKALDDIQLTLRNSIHLIRKARISPRTLMENPSLGSVLANGPGDSNVAETSQRDKVNIAPGVAAKQAGLSIGAQRMEVETLKEGMIALKALLGSLDRPQTNRHTESEREKSSENQSGVS